MVQTFAPVCANEVVMKSYLDEFITAIT